MPTMLLSIETRILESKWHCEVLAFSKWSTTASQIVKLRNMVSCRSQNGPCDTHHCQIYSGNQYDLVAVNHHALNTLHE